MADSPPSALRRPLRALRERRSLILGYHGVAESHSDHDPHNLRVAPARFRAQLELLLGAGFELLTVADLAARIVGGPPPPGFTALSFDDGMQDNHSTLLPILREYGVPATVYVTTGIIGEPNPWMAASSGARMMSAGELRELAGAGIELGAHTVTHPDMSLLDHEACLREMVDSRQAIERLTGAPVRTFAYPFCRYGEAALSAAREAGFLAAVTCEGRGGWKPLELGRAMLTGRDGWATFALKATDVYQPLFCSLPGRVLRGSTRRLRGGLRSLRDGDG